LLLALTVITFTWTVRSSGNGYKELGYMAFMMVGVGAQVIGNGVIAAILAIVGRKHVARAFLLSALAVGLIGTGFCFGGGAMM
jgi:hypothetical protein